MVNKVSYRFLFLSLACAGLGLLIWLVGFPGGWKEIREGARREWVKGTTTHIDENGDGVVDEERVVDPKTGKRTVRRDADRDGYFDLRYNLSESGVATNVARIHERAPRQRTADRRR